MEVTKGIIIKLFVVILLSSNVASAQLLYNNPDLPTLQPTNEALGSSSFSGNISGTGQSPQVAFFNSNSTVTSDPQFSYDTSTDTVRTSSINTSTIREVAGSGITFNTNGVDTITLFGGGTNDVVFTTDVMQFRDNSLNAVWDINVGAASGFFALNFFNFDRNISVGGNIYGRNVCYSNGTNCAPSPTFNSTYNNLVGQSCPAGQVVNGTFSNGTLRCTTVASGGSSISNSSLNTLYLNLSGTNANQNVNISGYTFLSRNIVTKAINWTQNITGRPNINQFSCSGVAPDCSTWDGDEGMCNLAGCTYFDPSCIGDPLSCSSFSTQGDCEQITCTWGVTSTIEQERTRIYHNGNGMFIIDANVSYSTDDSFSPPPYGIIREKFGTHYGGAAPLYMLGFTGSLRNTSYFTVTKAAVFSQEDFFFQLIGDNKNPEVFESFSGKEFYIGTFSVLRPFIFYTGRTERFRLANDTLLIGTTTDPTQNNLKLVVQGGNASINATTFTNVLAINRINTLMPACSVTANNTISGNATGVYGCNTTGVWTRLF